MRFFSNEAKDNVDDQEARTEALPQQRPGSPWDDRPGQNTDTGHDPAPQPTAFGAATPGGAVAASAMAGPYDDVDGDTHRSTDAASGVADDRTVAPGDGVVDDRAAGDRTVALGDVTADDRSRAHDDTVAWPAGEAPADRDPDVDVPLDDHDRDAQVDELIEDRGTFDDPRATGPSPDPAPEPSATGSAADDADEDRGTLDDPRVVSADGTSRAEAAEPEPEPEPVVAVAPAAVAGPAAFFPESETQPLRDRWRDIQLRFVDDPRATTAEAAALVDETIEKLTSSLRQHRASLAGGGDDTEALRMELRAYRDILDRLLGL